MTTLGPWPKGMNNREADHALPDGTVRNSVNADFDEAGKPRRRDGFTKVYSSIDCKGGFSSPIGSFFIERSDLKRFNADTNTTTIYKGIFGKTFTYDFFNGVVRFSDGLISLKISRSDVRKWGMDPPSKPLIFTSSGTYGKGEYLAAYCWVDLDGVESGTSEIAQISVNDGSGFTFLSLPVPQDPQIKTLRIYLSTANGKELYHVADTDADNYTITAGRYDGGNVCESQFLYPAPPGRIVRRYNDRYYVADEAGAVFYSEPFSPDRFRLGDDYLMFPGSVDIMEPVASGIFFAYGNNTDFYAGEPEEGFSISDKLSYGGIFGTSSKIQNSTNVAWQSQRGMVIGTADGQISNVQESNVATESAISGVSLIKEKNGLRQFIASLHQPTVSRMAAKSFIDAEIVRRGA